MGKWKTVVDFGEDGADIDDVIKALDQPAPSNTELREAIEQVLDWYFWTLDKAKEENRKSIHEASAKILALVQAREQQIFTELLGESIWYQEGGSSPKRAVPVSVIQRLQNKTNDGGNYGG